MKIVLAVLVLSGIAAVLSAAAAPAAEAVLPAAPQTNKCEWDNPCSGGSCANCDVTTEQGPFTYGTGDPPTCSVVIKIKVVCAGNPSTTCNSEETVACNSSAPLSITCNGCNFTIDPGAAGGACSDASWGGMGGTDRCACFQVSCS